jgi:hypothetical protein
MNTKWYALQNEGQEHQKRLQREAEHYRLVKEARKASARPQSPLAYLSRLLQQARKQVQPVSLRRARPA